MTDALQTISVAELNLCLPAVPPPAAKPAWIDSNKSAGIEERSIRDEGPNAEDDSIQHSEFVSNTASIQGNEVNKVEHIQEKEGSSQQPPSEDGDDDGKAEVIVPVHVGSSAAGAMKGDVTLAGPLDDSPQAIDTAELSIVDDIPWENRVREAADRDGETLVTIGPADADAMDAHRERLAQVAALVECDTTLVHMQAHPSKDGGKPQSITFWLVRKRPSEGHHLDLRVAVVGNVDAGKSTLVGVLTGPTSFLDDGRGLARSRVLRHKHEAETGRTSSIAEDQHMRLSSTGGSLATERHQKSSTLESSAETAKVVSFIDLAGHERYLRTTVYGLTAHEPDYVMVVVGANHGVTRMTKEHVGMAIALNVPLFVVITKVDLCPEPVMKETVKQLTRLLKLPGAKKQPYAVRNENDLMLAVRGFGRSALTPVFSISSVDGTNVPLLRQFFNLMPSRRSWASQDQLPAEFLIDQFFNVPGVGLVVAGTLLTGVVTVNHSLVMGPNNQGTFHQVTVKSIHHMRAPAAALLPGQTGAFVMRSRTKEHVRQFGIRKGMVLLEGTLTPVATNTFVCDVLVLHSQTTMRVNYQPILYARNVRQCVRIVEMDKDVLRTGVRARVTFAFMYRPEFLRVGTKVLFTEGKTKAIGTIRELID